MPRKDLPSSDDLYGEAVQSAVRIEDAPESINMLIRIVASLLVAGNDEYASALLPKILIHIRRLHDQREADYLLRLLIEQQCRMGRHEDASEALALFESGGEHREFALRDVAQAKARAGCFDEALRLAEEIEDLDDYESVLLAIGTIHAQERRFNDAIQLSGKFESTRPRAQLLRNLAVEQWADNRHDEAVRTLRDLSKWILGVENADNRDEILFKNVVALTTIHCIPDALTLAKEIKDPLVRTEAFCSVVVFARSAGNALGGRAAIDQAMEASKLIVDPFHRAKTLVHVGEALYRDGDIDGGQTVYREALTCMKSVRNIYSRVGMMVEFGAHLVQVDLPEAAHRVFALALGQIPQIETRSLQVLCLCLIIQAQIEASFHDEAFESVLVFETLRGELSGEEHVEGSLDRDLAIALGGVGAAFCREEEEERREKGRSYFLDAISIARRIAVPLNRSIALQNLAEQRSTIADP